MSEKLYKGVRPDGRDFYSGSVQWAPEKTKARKGRVVKHPSSEYAELCDFTTFLSVSTDPTKLPGSSWPLRLLEVEPVGDALRVDACKRGGVAFRVIREVDPALRFGPMGEHVVRLIEAAEGLTKERASDLSAAWDAAGYAARDAAWALVVRDLIGRGRFTQEHYDILTGPWRKVVGPIHPDDEDMR